MVNSEIRLIIFFAAKDGEKLYTVGGGGGGGEQELTVAQIMNSLFPNFLNSALKLRREGKPLSHSDMI